jgi:alkyl hydroperoxide reductase subunit AhpF
MSKNGNDNSHDSTEVKNLYDVIIIGSGPAGFTAGIYTFLGLFLAANL